MLIHKLLGIDPKDFEWQELALCKDMPPVIETDANGNKKIIDLWFDDYESSEAVAKAVDEVCLSCPVMKECFNDALKQQSAWGVWGGVFFVNGRQDRARNAHKSKATWQAIRERLG